MILRKFRVSAILILLVLVFVSVSCQSGPSEVAVTLTEWSVEIEPGSVSAGQINFNVLNAGALEHNFIIEGLEDGIAMLFAQKEDLLSVTLEAGTYTIMCDLPGHREAGMETEFTVSP